MLTKNCRLVLSMLRSQEKAKLFKTYAVYEVSDLCGLSDGETVADCEQLGALGYMALSYIDSYGGSKLDEIRLKEIGAHYNEKQRADIWGYILSKWIDFLALVVATIALILSVIALLH